MTDLSQYFTPAWAALAAIALAASPTANADDLVVHIRAQHFESGPWKSLNPGIGWERPIHRSPLAVGAGVLRDSIGNISPYANLVIGKELDRVRVRLALTVFYRESYVATGPHVGFKFAPLPSAGLRVGRAWVDATLVPKPTRRSPGFAAVLFSVSWPMGAG